MVDSLKEDCIRAWRLEMGGTPNWGGGRRGCGTGKTVTGRWGAVEESL